MSWAIDVDRQTVESAAAFESDALDTLLAALTPRAYNLAMRFVGHPVDAEDAAQEALIDVVRGLPSFRGDASFSTWAYRVVVRSLMKTRRRRLERMRIEDGHEALDRGLAHDAIHGTYDGPDAELFAEEVKLSCTTALLACLSRPLRMSYIVGEILGLPGPEAAAVLEITPELHRKRLSLARRTVRSFLEPRCQHIDASNACACRKQVAYDLEVGWVVPGDLKFAGPRRSRAKGSLQQTFDRVAALYASHPEYEAPEDLYTSIRETLADLGRVERE